jgi:hypothetical protein
MRGVATVDLVFAQTWTMNRENPKEGSVKVSVGPFALGMSFYQALPLPRLLTSGMASRRLFDRSAGRGVPGIPQGVRLRS